MVIRASAAALACVLVIATSCTMVTLGPDIQLPTFVRKPGDFHLLAAIQGALVVDENDCLMLEVAGGDRVLLAWPEPGARWDRAAQAVHMDGEVARVGADVLLGGGEVESPADADGWATPPSPECWRPTRWVVGEVETGP